MDRFDFTKSIGRLGYLGRMVLDFFIAVIILATLDPVDPSYFTIGILLMLLCMNFVNHVQRLNSAGANRWWSLLYFVPVVFLPFMIVMLFMRPSEEFYAEQAAEAEAETADA